MNRSTHIALFLAGGAFQAISAFEASWVKDYRAGLLVFAGVLLSAANLRGAFGRKP